MTNLRALDSRQLADYHRIRYHDSPLKTSTLFVGCCHGTNHLP